MTRHDVCAGCKGNASDKFLEILEPVPLYDLLSRMPCCHAVATTGQKAAEVVADITGTEVPKMGAMVECKDGLEIWRMPSSSRAYPMRSLRRKLNTTAQCFRRSA